jgi:hypothetical protein
MSRIPLLFFRTDYGLLMAQSGQIFNTTLRPFMGCYIVMRLKAVNEQKAWVGKKNSTKSSVNDQ